MTNRPVAAGKSSFDLIDQDIFFEQIISQTASTYLDLACGVGRYSLPLAQRLGRDSVIHAYDLWEEGIATLEANAKERGLNNIKPAMVDMTQRLPLEDAAVDVCFIATALHDIPAAKRRNVLEEVRRVLALNGVLALIEFKKLDHGPGPGKEHRISEDEADGLVAAQGFRKETSVSLGEYMYLARYSKGQSLDDW